MKERRFVQVLLFSFVTLRVYYAKGGSYDFYSSCYYDNMRRMAEDQATEKKKQVERLPYKRINEKSDLLGLCSAILRENLVDFRSSDVGSMHSCNTIH